MTTTKPEPVTRTRVVRRKITEYQCHYCGTWFEAKRPALTCSTSCRVMFHRQRKRKTL